MHCIGVDVSKQALVTFDGAEERTFPNVDGLEEFATYARRRRGVVIVFEPTSTYSRRLETLCRREGMACCCLNPRVIPHLREVARGRSKTDRSDAKLLYRYGVERGQAEAGGLAHDPLVQAVAAHLACYRVVQKARIAHQGVLEALQQDPSSSADLVAELRREIEALKGKEERHVEEAGAVIAEDEAGARALDLLLGIPGVGPITAITLLALFRKYGDANRRQMVALAGLDPIQIQSGTSVHGKSRISKRGSGEVRKRLYEATLSAARYNPKVQALYRRLKDQGKPDKVARIAAARKLLLIAHAIYQSGQPFRRSEEVGA
jgi:transposase